MYKLVSIAYPHVYTLKECLSYKLLSIIILSSKLLINCVVIVLSGFNS